MVLWIRWTSYKVLNFVEQIVWDELPSSTIANEFVQGHQLISPEKVFHDGVSFDYYGTSKGMKTEN
jgi:hypothetical protein